MLLAGVVAAVLVVTRLVDGPYVAAPPADAPAAADPVAAATALDSLERALAAGDGEAAASLAPSDDAAARSLLEALAGNARTLRVRDLDLRYIDTLGVPAEDGSWAVRADLTWSLGGVDRGVARSEVEVGLRSSAQAVGVTGFTGGRVPLWLRGPVLVDRGEGTLVITAGADPAPYSLLARRAVPQAAKVLGDSAGPLVVEVPRDAAGLDAVLGVPEGTYREVAAVTASVDGLLSTSSPVHVFVNPAELGRLRRTGAQVVMTHEAVHAVTGAPTSRAPVWLVEGFADYVALLDVDLPLSRTAAQVLERVREDGVPDRLPDESDFDLTAPHLGAAYEAAWLACRALASLAGEDGLVEVYRRTSDGEDVAAALAAVGTDPAEVTRTWQRLLVEAAG